MFLTSYRFSKEDAKRIFYLQDLDFENVKFHKAAALSPWNVFVKKTLIYQL